MKNVTQENNQKWSQNQSQSQQYSLHELKNSFEFRDCSPWFPAMKIAATLFSYTISWLKCNRLYVIAISFRCLFHQYFKVFAFHPNQSSCVCVCAQYPRDFNNILYQSALSIVSEWLFVKTLYTWFGIVCVRLLHFMANGERTISRAPHFSVELHKRESNSSDKNTNSAALGNQATHKWIENSATACIHGIKTVRHFSSLPWIIILLCAFNLPLSLSLVQNLRWLFIFQF